MNEVLEITSDFELELNLQSNELNLFITSTTYNFSNSLRNSLHQFNLWQQIDTNGGYRSLY